MTQEEKQLLLKDLCARLPYGVICGLSVKDEDVSITEKLKLGGLEHFIFGTMSVLPYLRPMLSMTEDEEKEYSKTCFFSHEIGDIPTLETFDWLNKHYFDYRGLIEKGLAIEAPEGMYKTD